MNLLITKCEEELSDDGESYVLNTLLQSALSRVRG
jgi:hypothetical protein